MCGIAGSSPADPGFMDLALARMADRGPDSHGVVSCDRANIGVRRLAISDIAHGDQPITSSSGDLHIVFNGAIYNARSLGERFGLRLRTRNDAEVVLALFETLGQSMVDHLEGMFSFIILDMREGTLYFGVDQLGIKPLYMASIGESVMLASTIDAFRPEWLMRVERVPTGVVWSLDGPHHVAKMPEPGTDWTDEFRRAVESQIPGDVGWGCLLSGGVDSSLLVRIASETCNVRTFSCGIADSTDLVQARRVADFLRTDHHEAIITPDRLRELALRVVQVTASFEPWLVLGGIGTLAVARAARIEGARVVLSGEGADELFAGYRDFDHVPIDLLESVLQDQQSQLGSTECLRLDRCSMAEGIEARVPFLAQPVVAAVRRLPPTDKRDHPGEVNSGTKVALRRFASTMLPSWVTERPKVGFSAGTGVVPLLAEIAESSKSDWASPAEQRRFAAPGLDMSAPIGAWLLGMWLSLYGDRLGSDWETLARRRLVRR